MDDLHFKKAKFFFSLIEDGWSIKKTQNDIYILTKSHLGKKQYLSTNYLSRFLKEHL